MKKKIENYMTYALIAITTLGLIGIGIFLIKRRNEEKRKGINGRIILYYLNKIKKTNEN